jgi:hypothetical protein
VPAASGSAAVLTPAGRATAGGPVIAQTLVARVGLPVVFPGLGPVRLYYSALAMPVLEVRPAAVCPKDAVSRSLPSQYPGLYYRIATQYARRLAAAPGQAWAIPRQYRPVAWLVREVWAFQEAVAVPVVWEPWLLAVVVPVAAEPGACGLAVQEPLAVRE